MYFQVYGPYRNREGRNIVRVRKYDGKMKTMSYARYIMETHLQRYLSKEETVDHIDNDKTNDRIENLQLLSRIDNINKFINSHETKIELECIYCHKRFKRSLKVYWRNIYEREMDGPFCSKECVGKVYH